MDARKGGVSSEFGEGISRPFEVLRANRLVCTWGYLNRSLFPDTLLSNDLKSGCHSRNNSLPIRVRQVRNSFHSRLPFFSLSTHGEGIQRPLSFYHLVFAEKQTGTEPLPRFRCLIEEQGKVPALFFTTGGPGIYGWDCPLLTFIESVLSTWLTCRLANFSHSWRTGRAVGCGMPRRKRPTTVRRQPGDLRGLSGGLLESSK